MSELLAYLDEQRVDLAEVARIRGTTPGKLRRSLDRAAAAIAEEEAVLRIARTLIVRRRTDGRGPEFAREALCLLDESDRAEDDKIRRDIIRACVTRLSAALGVAGADVLVPHLRVELKSLALADTMPAPAATPRSAKPSVNGKPARFSPKSLRVVEEVQAAGGRLALRELRDRLEGELDPRGVGAIVTLLCRYGHLRRDGDDVVIEG